MTAARLTAANAADRADGLDLVFPAVDLARRFGPAAFVTAGLAWARAFSVVIFLVRADLAGAFFFARLFDPFFSSNWTAVFRDVRDPADFDPDWPGPDFALRVRLDRADAFADSAALAGRPARAGDVFRVPTGSDPVPPETAVTSCQ